jgi:hypothetical protein
MIINRLTLASLVFNILGILGGATTTACLPYQDKIPFWILILCSVASAACPTIAIAIQKVQPIQLTKEGKIRDNRLIKHK